MDPALAFGNPDPDLIAAVCPAGVHVSDSVANNALTQQPKWLDAEFVTGCCPECHSAISVNQAIALTCHDAPESKYMTECG